MTISQKLVGPLFDSQCTSITFGFI